MDSYLLLFNVDDRKAKLYRFDKEGNQWKERGVGTLKLLKHKESDKIRLVMRQNKTLKICANHLGKFTLINMGFVCLFLPIDIVLIAWFEPICR